MSIQDLGAIGELLGSIAIFVTLVYLAIQTRLNRKALMDSALIELNRSFSSVNQNIIGSPEIALLYESGLRDPAQLNKEQALRFFMLVREAMNGYLSIYAHYQSGHLDKRAWDATGFEIFASCPGVIQFIETQRQTFEPGFLKYFDSIDKSQYDDPVRAMVGGAFESDL